MAIQSHPLALFSLANHHALVTGGNSGLGAAMAQALALAGADVTLVARRTEKLTEVANSIQTATQHTVRIDTLSADLATETGLDACIKQLPDTVDILVNAAGINMRMPMTDIKHKDWQIQVNLNLTTPFFLSQACAQRMKQKRWGRIINIASLQSFRAFANSASYGASKGGIVQLTRALARELGEYAITCNAIGPGFFPTELTAPVFADEQKARANAEQTCLGRNGELDDIHGLTVFLASEAASYITGQTIMLDGGFSAK